MEYLFALVFLFALLGLLASSTGLLFPQARQRVHHSRARPSIAYSLLIGLALLSSVLVGVITCSRGQAGEVPAVDRASESPTPGGSATPTTIPLPVASATSPSAATPQPTVTVAFIDVGQADAILVDYGTTEVLIDGGTTSSAASLVSYLRGRVDGPLEAVVATHPDADHIGGLATVLREFQVQNIWFNGETKDTQVYEGFTTAVESEHATTHAARRGDNLAISGLDFEVLSPISLSGSTNENSVVMQLEYGEIAFLFMGDAGASAEAAMVSAGLIHEVEVLKVGHHGSKYSSSPSFLNVAQPAIAIYMAGTGNTYGHPHPETIAALQSIGAKIYGTDKNGTIEVNTDGHGYSVVTAR